MTEPKPVEETEIKRRVEREVEISAPIGSSACKKSFKTDKNEDTFLSSTDGVLIDTSI
jgi:hypothetical protein